MIAIEEKVARLQERQLDMLGNAGLGRAYTATLRVSPDGSNTDGLSWRTAYNNLNDALDACGADANDLTLILVAPGTYDINESGQPTWTQNVVLQGNHRDYVVITNTHATASCVLRLEGLSAVFDVSIDHIAGDNGLLMWADGAVVRRLHITSTALTGAGVSLWMDGDDSIADDICIRGNLTNTVGLNVLSARCQYSNINICNCATGIWIHNAGADMNRFSEIMIHGCALGIDIDSGNQNMFNDIRFHNNTRNVDSEVQDQFWENIFGHFPIRIDPDNLVGILVACGAAGVYGADTQVIAAAAIDNPFRIVGVNFGPDATPAEWYTVRFTDSGGAPYYDVLMFHGDKREGAAAPSGTEYIFNADTRISCSARSVTGGNNVDVWLEIQEI